MNDLQIFRNNDFGEIRTLEENGTVLFCGSDVAKALGYENARDALKRHCKGVVKRDTITTKGNQEMSFIPEGDVYRLIVRSKLPSAEKFEHWVFDDILPSIRRTGGYIQGQDVLSPAELMAKALMVAQQTLAERDARISALTVENQILLPKAEYFDALADRNTLTSIRETAKQFEIKERDFVAILIKKKFLYRDKKGKLMPYAGREGRFEIKECFNEKTQWSGTQTLITPKGREVFLKLFRS